MHVAPCNIRRLTGFTLGAVCLFCLPAHSDSLLGNGTMYQPTPVLVATASPSKVVAAPKKNRRNSKVRRPLELTLPRLMFSSALPSSATRALPPTVLLEPYEPARFHRFGPSSLQPVTSLATSLRTDALKDEPFRIGFSPDWNLQWDLLQDSTPASGHRFGVNVGLQRKF